MKTLLTCIIISCLAIILFISNAPVDDSYRGWRTYGGTNDASRYSSLSQINVDNVKNLKKVWEYHTADSTKRSQIQCQPIVVDGVLYGASPQVSIFALDAATGKEIWRFNPFRLLGGENSWAGTSRGVTYWEDGKDKRILFCAGNFMMCLDAKTGEPVMSFGDGAKVDLQKDLDYGKEKFLIVSNTPGIIYKDLIIMGMRLSEGLDAAPGHVRAYNVRTGKREWIFHTIPHPNEVGYNTWDKDSWKQVGGANNWAGMSLDEKKGIVYVPTGSATYDFWGGYRKGQNLFANCILALDASTGKRVWHYQTIHHDVWDRDLPANPNLVTIYPNNKKVEALAQITKHGFIFLLDRQTGKPIFPINEVPVPQSTLKGEKTWATQPVPTLPEPYMRQRFMEKDIIDITPAHHAEILERFKKFDSGNMWLPPSSKKGIVSFPGFDGGGEWGGAAFDPETQMLYVNANEMPWTIEMKENKKAVGGGQMAAAQQTYANTCANCHGLDRKGNAKVFPSLIGLNKKYDAEKLGKLLITGKGAMPSFKHLSEGTRQSLISFLLDLKETSGDKKELGEENPALQADYLMTGYNRFLTKDGYPAIKPPWGTLNAINLNTGKLVWKSVLGEFEELSKKGIPATGTENYGGPAVTAGGLIFIAATKDEKFRVFDKKTGKVLYEAKIPAAGHATPAVYEVNGKQYVVIACGGGKGTRSGDAYVAFGLE